MTLSLVRGCALTHPSGVSLQSRDVLERLGVPPSVCESEASGAVRQCLRAIARTRVAMQIVRATMAKNRELYANHSRNGYLGIPDLALRLVGEFIHGA